MKGSIRAGNEAITYYKDPHELSGKCDFVMANPPFNVDEVDAEKVKGDKRLPFGLPGVNKSKKVSNANYLWLQYFYSYLNENGRAGAVMSSQSSSAGRDEAKVRQKMVESGAVDVMIDIRGNFFYTRTVPCQLWFFDRAKERDEARCDHVLMLDARNIYRKVTRAIFDFSPEQQKNIAAIVWLYRGQSERFLSLVESYLAQAVAEGQATAGPLLGVRGGARQADRSGRALRQLRRAIRTRWRRPGRTSPLRSVTLSGDIEAFVGRGCGRGPPSGQRAGTVPRGTMLRTA